MNPSPIPTTAPAQPVAFEITGMSCGHCVAAVTRALEELPGVKVRDVARGSALVELDAGAASVETVIDAIRDAGYDARVAGADGFLRTSR